ncbi:MAG: MCE family protein [Candidatus Saganbacteria bacterium]|nr:MCE family protein [Candidatus Saganbacteria bacterium]
MSTQVKVGIVTLVGLVLISLVIVWKSEIMLVGKGYELRASFENIEGLTVGSEVRFRGLKVGKVLRIDPGPYDIKIYSVISPDIKIPADSILRVAYDGIVGLKYLEIRPGTSEVIYTPQMELQGLRTAAIVDFIDIGSKNLVETKAILENVRRIIENPELQRSFTDVVFTAEKVTNGINKLTEELRETNKGIRDIVTDPRFQANVKGTINETEKTLSSANRFFENIGKVNMRVSGGIDVGSRSNAVKGDVDVIQSEKTYYRVGFGEGPTRQPGLLDFLLTNRVDDRFGYRLGVINNQLGGGVIFQPTAQWGNILADIYDINNPRPNNPRMRVGYEQQVQDYMDLLLQADDILNSGNSNFMFGVRVKSPDEKLY